MSLTAEQLELIKLYRQLSKYADEVEDGTLEMAIRLADEFTEITGLKAIVIRRKNIYIWVTEYFFGTYKYTGKYYHETEVKLDEEV